MIGWNAFDIVKVDCLSRPSNISCGTLILNLEYPVSARILSFFLFIAYKQNLSIEVRLTVTDKQTVTELQM